MTDYRPPRHCPVCQHRMHLTQLGCPECGTGLSGNFVPCAFCGLDDKDLDALRVFLTSKGNMKELERHLGVSYPTARARFDDLLTKLGMADEPTAPGATAVKADADGGRNGGPGATTTDPRLATLEALARGDIGVDAAKAELSANES